MSDKIYTVYYNGNRINTFWDYRTLCEYLNKPEYTIFEIDIHTNVRTKIQQTMKTLKDFLKKDDRLYEGILV